MEYIFLPYSSLSVSNSFIDYSLSRIYQTNENILTMRIIFPLDFSYTFVFTIFNILSSFIRSKREEYGQLVYMRTYEAFTLVKLKWMIFFCKLTFSSSYLCTPSSLWLYMNISWSVNKGEMMRLLSLALGRMNTLMFIFKIWNPNGNDVTNPMLSHMM